ncbi:uncharacterized protein LOC143567245 [Bidens hawaiensis]|uniref:uncharacterized protein LOC143567245 n=1 Tax=Bidens hawaiensis TaxID=980011 RepID=UPI0040497169
MNAWVKTVSELHGMHKTVEMNVATKTILVLMVRSAGVKKPKPNNQGNNVKGKNRVTVAAKSTTNTNKDVAKVPLPPPEDRQCYKCNKMGHWKRNYPDYLAELKRQRTNSEISSKGA